MQNNVLETSIWIEQLSTITDWIRYSASCFERAELYYGHGCDNALDEAAALVLGALKLPYDLHHSYFSAKLLPDERALLADLLERRITARVPTAYLTQRTLYGGLLFYIDERALIPRSPIAELLAKHLAPWWSDEYAPTRILDLCCGSGCIGILAQHYAPEAEVVLADIDADALEVANINVDKHRLNCEIIQTDMFSNLSGQFDWILCNPPYVENAEMEHIASEYHHEPIQALVSGDDGLAFTRKLLYHAADYLTENGLLVLEVGMSWQNLIEAYPEVAFDWVAFEQGGEGVLVMARDELLAWRDAGVFSL